MASSSELIAIGSDDRTTWLATSAIAAIHLPEHTNTSAANHDYYEESTTMASVLAEHEGLAKILHTFLNNGQRISGSIEQCAEDFVVINLSTENSKSVVPLVSIIRIDRMK